MFDFQQFQLKQFHRIQFSIMKHGCFQQCRPAILPVYLVFQILLCLAISHLDFCLGLHIPLSLLAIITYFTVALKNPGKVVLEELKTQKQIELKSEKGKKGGILPCDIAIQDKIDKVVNSQLAENGLGLESNIKSEDPRIEAKPILKAQTPKKVEKKDSCIKEGQIGMGLVIQEPSGFVACPSALKAVERVCQVCKINQPMRVRHCVDCGVCIYTFDHHCPWLNNCIGQKNKFNFLLYLVAQQIQFFVLGVQIALILTVKFQTPVVFLCFGVFLTGVVLFGILVFHISLVSKNLTTWQHLRWTRIEYLNIFYKEKLGSLFDRGFKSNISILLWGSCSSDPVNWMKELNPSAHNCLIKAKSQTERRLSCIAI